MRETGIDIRVSAEEKRTFQEAAKSNGLTLSAWARERLLKTARSEKLNQQIK